MRIADRDPGARLQDRVARRAGSSRTLRDGRYRMRCDGARRRAVRTETPAARCRTAHRSRRALRASARADRALQRRRAHQAGSMASDRRAASGLVRHGRVDVHCVLDQRVGFLRKHRIEQQCTGLVGLDTEQAGAENCFDSASTNTFMNPRVLPRSNARPTRVIARAGRRVPCVLPCGSASRSCRCARPVGRCRSRRR